MIADTLLLNSVNANILFDSGAIKSFISRDIAYKLNQKAKPLKYSLQVEIANQEVVLVDQVHPDCKLEIGNRHYHVDLISFKLGEFDVILRMDWLSSNGAQINCKGKKVILKVPEGKEVIFKGKR